MIGALSIVGAAGGVALANVLPGAVLRGAFALPMLLIAAQLMRRTKNDPNQPEKA